MGDGVLDDQGAHPLGMGERQTEPDRAAIILQVKTGAISGLATKT